MAEVRYSVQVVEGLDKGALAAAVLEEHGVHIPQVVVGQKQLLEPHAVMVVVMVEEGQVMATLARREAHLAAARTWREAIDALGGGGGYYPANSDGGAGGRGEVRIFSW